MIWALVRCCVTRQNLSGNSPLAFDWNTHKALLQDETIGPCSAHTGQQYTSDNSYDGEDSSAVNTGTRLNWCRISVHLSHRRNKKSRGVCSHLTLPKAPMPKVLLSRYRPMTTGTFSIPSSLFAPVSPSFFHQQQYLPSVPLTRLCYFTGYRL